MKRRYWLMLGAAMLTAGGGAAYLHMNAATAATAPTPDRSTPPTQVYHSSVPPSQRRALFGELHLHTAFSTDAWGFGARLNPDDAFHFGRGLPVKIPAYQLAWDEGLAPEKEVMAQRAWPLDFMAVTDHAEQLAVNVIPSTMAAAESGAAGAAGPGGRGGRPFDPMVQKKAWQMIEDAANGNNRPGKFTTFVAYEWTSGEIHRNVIYNAAEAPEPFTSRDSRRPEDLWSFLEKTRARGIDVIAIPHNGNESNGLMYDWNDSDGKPIDEAYAQRRATNEPLTEISQTKGTSDTHPSLSPNDEFGDFELFERVGRAKAKPPGSYVRDALGRGLIIQDRVGVNPYKYGFTGGSDIHNGLSNSDESGMAGGQHGVDPKTMLPRGDDARRAIATLPPVNSFGGGQAAAQGPKPDPGPRLPGQSKDPPQTYPLQVERSSAALTGVWAEENSRNAIFAALKRKETFATTGTRMRVRAFGGWNFSPTFTQRKDWVAQAYAQGVPMGADLPAAGATAAGPSLIVQAMKDPTGANLDRAQVIKITTDGSGKYVEKIFDVALSDSKRRDASGHVKAVGNTVNLKTGAYTNTIGATTLTTVWRDPEFDPRKPAVYYVRVLEIPTPRWSTLLAIKAGIERNDKVPATIQERGWSSPIWYTPVGRRQAAAAPAKTAG